MYLIDTPPPTISGELHIGHIFSYVPISTTVKYQRTIYQEVLAPFAVDCNGIPTWQLLKKNNLWGEAREQFIADKTKEFKQTFDDFKINFSEHSYNTMDQMTQDICLLSFNDLVTKGLCYKAKATVLWDEKLQISVSQSELDEQGNYERTGVKPILKETTGWFIKIDKQKILEQIDKIEFSDEKYKNRLVSWVEQINQDWSISRERDFGIAIPNEEGMVFDTWFISSLTPQLAWASHTGFASLDCPIFDIRFQGHDILRTWALFTIVKSLYHNNQIPWKKLVVTGHVLDSKGNKISKSLGNSIPLDKYKDRPFELTYWGTLAPIGTDTRFSEAVLNDGRKLKNKILNANRFIEMQENDDFVEIKPYFFGQYGISTVMIQELLYSKSLLTIKDYFWNTFCNIEIEGAKKAPNKRGLQFMMSRIEKLFSILIN